MSMSNKKTVSFFCYQEKRQQKNYRRSKIKEFRICQVYKSKNGKVYMLTGKTVIVTLFLKLIYLSTIYNSFIGHRKFNYYFAIF